MKKIALLSLVTSSFLLAGGWKIPETSTNAVALGAANIAHNHNNADTAYYNPANMVFMSDENHLEIDAMYIGLDGTNYKGSYTNNGIVTTTGHDLNAKKENFIVPSLHYVSKKLGNSGARVGLSIVSPAGLSKRWEDSPAKTSAEEFTLTTIEVNPTAAFEVTDKVALAVGFRILYSDGVVKSNGTLAVGGSLTSEISRDMTGDSLDFGFNMALAYKPTSDLEIGLTYRSKIDLSLEGNAKLNSTAVPAAGIPAGTYDGGASVTVPVPAIFSAAIAYTLPTKTTLELVYQKTYWSAYKELDFNYSGTLTNPLLVGAFDNSKVKNWKDTNTFRLGVTQELDALTLMAGLVIDESPVPDATLSFELPDSDSTAVSLGGRYKINDRIDVGVSGLYSMRKDRTVSNSSLSGTFSNSNVIVISAGLGYKF